MRRSSNETKAIILASARERFAAEGYDRATIRAIAADARIDPAMVMRYFGSKEQLFAAAADVDLELFDLTAVPSDRIGSALVVHFLDRWERDEALVILLRAGVTQPEVAERMREVFAAQLMPIVIRFVHDPAEAPKRAALIAAQVLGVTLSRYILHLPPLVAMGREEIIDWIGPTLQRYLNEERPRTASGAAEAV